MYTYMYVYFYYYLLQNLNKSNKFNYAESKAVLN